jgi:hypothetical protein
VTAVVLLGDIVERPTQRYLVTEVLNMWEVSMGGSHSINNNTSILIANKRVKKYIFNPRHRWKRPECDHVEKKGKNPAKQIRSGI